uniref:Nucleoprotein n=1 Tax=Culex pipiens TaxID=7175 RepID=A0A8D8AWN7_CULPI
MYSEIISVRTGEVLRIPERLSCGRQPGEHPSENNMNKKPSVTLPSQAVTLDQVRTTLKKQILDLQRPEIDLVLLYLRKLAESMKSPPLDTDWESFGSLIGKARESISPLNLVSVVDRPTEVPMLTGNATEKDDNWMLILLAALYRLSPVLNEGYRKSLFRTLGSKLREAGLANTRLLETFYGATRGVWNDSEFVKLVAILDMYFVRFPDHQLSGARIGTGESRYKECTALKSLLDFSEQIGKSIADIGEWLWISVLHDEFKVITKPGQELDNPFSYTPYLKDLRLVGRSAYSAANNPNMHLFIHAIGSALGVQRSKNAMINRNSEACPDTIENASVFAYVLILAKEKSGDGDMSSQDWLRVWKEGGSKMNEAFSKVYKIWANMEQMRPGTVGELVRSKAIAKLNLLNF